MKILCLPMAKQGGTIKRFRDNGKWHNGAGVLPLCRKPATVMILLGIAIGTTVQTRKI
jgi:hypothetical protein